MVKKLAEEGKVNEKKRYKKVNSQSKGDKNKGKMKKTMKMLKQFRISAKGW